MGLVSIDAVTVDVRMPNFSEGADPFAHGAAAFGLSGLMPWAQARTLKELSLNESARITTHGQTGVPVELVFAGDEQEAITGAYLLQAFDFTATYLHRKIGYVSFELQAVHIP